VSELPHILNTDFLSPTTKYAGKPSKPVINFDEVDIEEPEYSSTPQQQSKTPPPQTNGKWQANRIKLKEIYIAKGGKDKRIIDTPDRNLRANILKQYINLQDRINESLSSYITNNGNDPNVLNSQNPRFISNATKALIKQNNAQKKR
jgi:hypothetical protein